MVKNEKIEAAREAVTNELDRLVKAHGFPMVRAACHRYLNLANARIRAKKEIVRLEKELDSLRKVV